MLPHNFVVNVIRGSQLAAADCRAFVLALEGIGATVYVWRPDLNHEMSPMDVVRQAAGAPDAAMIFLGHVRGLQYSSAKGMLGREFPNLPVFYADPKYPRKAVGQVRALLPPPLLPPPWWWRFLSAFAGR